MIEFLIISVCVTLLAYYSEKQSVVIARTRSGRLRRLRRREINAYGFYSILVILIMFVGLRSELNDMWLYKIEYRNLETGWNALWQTQWSLASNPGFHVLNVSIKSLISENAKVMFFLYAMLTLVSFILFYRSWSPLLWLTVFLFATSSTLLFTMGAVKQALAMAFGLCGITCFLKQKRKWFVVWVLLGSAIHAYVPFYFAAFLLNDKVWSRKVILIVLATALGGFFFIEYLIEITATATEILGAEYAKRGELAGPGMNILRFLIYCVAPVLTWIYRDRINVSNDRVLILFSNFALIGWCFMFIALFVSANMFGRMAMYFDPFMHIALTTLLVRYISAGDRIFIIPGCMLGYSIFLLFELYTHDFVY